MHNNIIVKSLAIGSVLLVNSCIPVLTRKAENKTVPQSYNTPNQDSTSNAGTLGRSAFFKNDPNLKALIDTAVMNNQDLNIIMQDIVIANNTVRWRKGQYLPFVNLGVGAGFEKASRYTRAGAVDATTPIAPGRNIPEPLPDFLLGPTASWQVDIWKQLRNSKKAAFFQFLATQEGKNFMVTNLVVEIASNYYELMALDNELSILQKNIQIQEDALEIVRLEKISARVTELAVRRFEAEIAKNKSHQYFIKQQIVEAENRINFLKGGFPRPITRNSQGFIDLVPDSISSGIPSQMLANRPDIKQSELQLSAAKLNIKVAKAYFYPAFNIVAGLGYEAFNAKYFITTPQSLLYNIAGSLVAPVVNRNAIKADYYSANARQIQAVYNYEKTILNAYIEAVNQLSNINNLANSFKYKAEQVDALNKSVGTSINLFRNARADYVEILLTQRDALESKMDLVEIKQDQLTAAVKMYQVLGGGWQP